MTIKALRLTQSEAEKMRDAADTAGTSLSAVGRGWIEGFVETGLDYGLEREQTTLVQIVVDDDVLRKAEHQARVMGLALSDVIRHEISKLR